MGTLPSTGFHANGGLSGTLFFPPVRSVRTGISPGAHRRNPLLVRAIFLPRPIAVITALEVRYVRAGTPGVR